MENKIPVYKQESPQAIALEALKKGDALAASQEESQLLLQIKGVSINAKPRKDGRYQGYLMIDGKPVTFYGRTKEEVSEKIQRAIQTGQVPKRKKTTKKDLTLSEWLTKWITLYKKPNLKVSSLLYVERALKPAIAALGTTALGKLTTDDIQRLLLSIESSRSRDACRCTLAQALQKALKQGMIKTNPCDAVEIKKHKKQHRSALTLAQQADFTNAIRNSEYEPLLLFLLGTGLRIGEALALTSQDIDQESHTVNVNKNVLFISGQRIAQNTPKSDAGVRTVPILNFAWNAIQPLGQDDSDLFAFKYSAVHTYLRRLSDKLGFTVTAHILRHTYATRLEEAGVSPKLKQYLLGHSSLEMTQQVYTDIQPEYVKQKSATLLNAFSLSDTKN